VVKSLDEIISLAREMSPKKRLFVAAAAEHAALESCALAFREGLADITLVGDKENIERISKSDNIDLKGLEIINVPDEKDALIYCMESYRDGKADVLMKGKLSTGKMMQTALKKEYGLRTNRVLSHVAIFEHEERLVIMSDGGINIKPDIGRKAGIIENSVQAAHALGIENPKVAILAAVEKVQLQAMPATRDAAILRKMYERGEITGCVVEGPLSLDLALSRHSAQTKGVKGEVPGKADIIIAPDIACGNMIYKTISTIKKSPLAGFVAGSRTPVIIVSRADRTQSKLYSVAACVYFAHKVAEA
jgi:phosphate butyryltransferase